MKNDHFMNRKSMSNSMNLLTDGDYWMGKIVDGEPKLTFVFTIKNKKVFYPDGAFYEYFVDFILRSGDWAIDSMSRKYLVMKKD